MKKPEYPSSNGSHSSHPKLRLPFQWSTRRRLVTTIVIVFFMLTGVVTAMTYYVVNRQLETVTVNKSFTQAEDADEQHSLNSQAIPPDSGKDYVSAGYDSGKDYGTRRHKIPGSDIGGKHSPHHCFRHIIWRNNLDYRH